MSPNPIEAGKRKRKAELCRLQPPRLRLSGHLGDYSGRTLPSVSGAAGSVGHVGQDAPSRPMSHPESTRVAKISFDRSSVLGRLGFPLTARLEFGGREWLQDFDEHGRLIVTVTP